MGKMNKSDYEANSSEFSALSLRKIIKLEVN